jgi:hypothetical protein
LKRSLFPAIFPNSKEKHFILLILYSFYLITPLEHQPWGGIMTYKRIEDSLSFADIAVQKYVDKNRSMQFLSQINSTID